MKTLLFLAPLTALLSLVTGCADTRATTAPNSEPEPAATYKAGHGLLLSEAAHAFIGIETIDVAMHTFDGGRAVESIPAGALLRTVRGNFVYVANGPGFLLTPVVIGALDATRVEIREGLYEGDIVVTRGVRDLALAEIQALNGGVGCADGH